MDIDLYDFWVPTRKKTINVPIGSSVYSPYYLDVPAGVNLILLRRDFHRGVNTEIIFCEEVAIMNT